MKTSSLTRLFSNYFWLGLSVCLYMSIGIHLVDKVATDSRIHDFDSPGKRAGLALIASTGLLSSIATFTLLSYFTYCAVQIRLRGHSTPLSSGVYEFLTTALGKYLLSLIISDFCQGIAFVTNYKWAIDGYLEENGACIFQGAISQIGDLGAALWSNVIAFQTFWLLFVQKKPAHKLDIVVLFVVWTILLLLPILGPTVMQKTERNGPFWGYSGAWCWVGNGYQLSRLFYLYVWVFLNLFCCFIIYLLIYLKFTGLVDYDPSKRFKFAWSFGRGAVMHSGEQPTWKSSSTFTREEHPTLNYRSVNKHLIRVARRLTLYPVVYAIVVIPVAVCRMGVLAGWTPPFWLYTFAGTCFSSSGFANTVLFLVTRHSFIQRSMRSPALNIFTTRHIEITVDDFPTPRDNIPLQSLKPSPPSPGYPFYDEKDRKSGVFESHVNVVLPQTDRDLPLTPNENEGVLLGAAQRSLDDISDHRFEHREKVHGSTEQIADHMDSSPQTAQTAFSPVSPVSPRTHLIRNAGSYE